MEETLLLPKENKRVSSNSKSSSSGSGFVQEFKKVSLMAAPMVVVSVSQFLLQVVSLMMAGRSSWRTLPCRWEWQVLWKLNVANHLEPSSFISLETMSSVQYSFSF
ncbi:hypothetical protein JHK85_050586 [Glycine max]|uniref:MATE efflux family protein 8 n=1 Tax=Glycine soja TaxID=3848 RepID=A0A0B2SLE6_GLYSO|nr:hypothetical protein JHK85_050586 [Glycine max]KHN45184.1 MATE efflux family protein 8 [Glycine soja]